MSGPGARRVLVTGATGGLGRAVVARLAAEGADVLGLSLHGGDLPGARVVAGDVRTAPWAELVARRDAVIHLAAFVHRQPASPAEAAELSAVNAASVAALGAACRAASARLVLASTVAVLGAGGEGLGDDAPPRPVTPYGRSKLEAEQALAAEARAGLRGAALRFPMLYGPHGRGNLERLLAAIRAGRFWPIGGATLKSCLHFDDAARACLLAAADGGPEGTFVVAPPAPVALRDLLAACWLAAGRRQPAPALPAGAAGLAGGSLDAVLRLAGRPPRFAAQVRTLIAPAWYDGSRFAAATGFTPAIALADGLADTVRWLADQGGRP